MENHPPKPNNKPDKGIKTGSGLDPKPPEFPNPFLKINKNLEIFEREKDNIDPEDNIPGESGESK